MRELGPSNAPQEVLVPGGAWWDLDEPGLIEHLDPGLVLSSLTDFEARSAASMEVLRARPRHESDLDAAAFLVYVRDDEWQGTVDSATGVLVSVTSHRNGVLNFRSDLEWIHRPDPPSGSEIRPSRDVLR